MIQHLPFLHLDILFFVLVYAAGFYIGFLMGFEVNSIWRERGAREAVQWLWRKVRRKSSQN